MKRISTNTSGETPGLSDPTQMFGSLRDRLDFYRQEIQYETQLLSDRSNAYLGAQSFLVAVYASSMANLNPEWGKLFTLVVPILLAILGVAISAQAWPGIKYSYEIIDHWYAKQTFLLRQESFMDEGYDGPPLFNANETMENGNSKALSFSLRSPWVFGVLWVVLGAFAGYIHFG